MSLGPQLEEILLRWDEYRERGEAITLEALCRDHPDQLDEVRRLVRNLEGVDALISNGEALTEVDASEGINGFMPGEVSTGSRYTAIRLHESGGLGDIFLAFDEQLRREVVLKLIKRPHNSDQSERFLREAAITARLGHPGIVPIFGLGRTGDGRLCYAMRYIEGETLGAAIRRFHLEDSGQIPRVRTPAFRGLLTRLIAVCHAVAFAHSRGVIHRDLKPDNVMLGPYQETLVVDWGLAKRWRDETDRSENLAFLEVDEEKEPAASPPESPEGSDLGDTLTKIGATLGTPAFMSPEQAGGQPEHVGPASDVYSLGATLFILLTGRPAFKNRSQRELLDQVRRGDFSTPRHVNAATPPALEAVCLKAMSLRPADRYAGAMDLAADLERWLADEPVSVWREPPSIRLGRWVRRHRPLVAGFAALAATALVALTLSTLLLGQEQTKTKLALADARANYRLARTTMADVQTSFGLSAAERRAPNEAALWFAEAAETADIVPDLARNSRIRARGWSLLGPIPIAMLDHPDMQSYRGGSPTITQLAFDGSGGFLFSLAISGACVVHDIRADQRLPLPDAPQIVSTAAWGGPAKDILAMGDREGNVVLIRVPGGEVIARLFLKGGVSNLEFNADGGLLALGGTSTRVWSLERKTFVTLELIHPALAARLAFSPRSDRLAVASVDGLTWVYDLSSASSTPLFQAGIEPNTIHISNGRRPLCPVFVDEGRGLVRLSSNRELVWYDATTGKEVRRLSTSLLNIYDLQLSPDGRAFAVMGAGGLYSWDTRTGQSLGHIGDASVEAGAFTPDGSWFLQSNGHYLAAPVRFPGGEPGSWVLRHQDAAWKIAISPDGSLFALAQAGGLVRVWSFPSVAPNQWPIHKISASARLALSPDGRLAMPLGKYLSRGPSFTHVHNLSTARIGPKLEVEGFLHGGAIAPGGQQVVTLSSPANILSRGDIELQYPIGASKGSVHFWDPERGVSVLEPVQTPSEPIAAAYSPDGSRLVVLCTRGECLWIDPATGTVSHRRTPEKSRFVAGWPANELLRFSPDGSLLFQWGTGRPVLMDARTGLDHTPAFSPLQEVHGELFDARFSMDGRYLATASGDKTVQVWELATGKPAAKRLLHPDWIFQTDFSADGSMLLTGCRDGKARVWNWRTGELFGLPLAHQGEVQDVHFLNDDRWVLTKCSVADMKDSMENALQIWDWRTGKPLTPPRLLASAWGSQLCLTADKRHAVLGGAVDQSIHSLDLASWADGDDPRFPAERLREIVEIFSGQKIVGGSSVVSLTSAEWINRWRSYRSYFQARASKLSLPRP